MNSTVKTSVAELPLERVAVSSKVRISPFKLRSEVSISIVGAELLKVKIFESKSPGPE